MSVQLTIPGLSLGEVIGRGARSVVYRGRARDRAVAVKVHLEGSPSAFLREAAYLGCLRHHGLPRVLEVGRVERSAYLVTELFEGRLLSDRLAQGPLEEPEVARLGAELATILDQIHRRGLVHRDVKPANVVLTEAGARLVDFGFAGRAGREPQQAVGTFLYSPPEQTGMIRRPVDGRADLYSLGVILYECLAGQPPFQADQLSELLRLHAVSPPPPLESKLAGVVARLLAKDPDDRYPSARALALDLEGLRSGTAPGAELSSEGPLFGREAEMQRLREVLDSVRSGRSRAFLLEGEPGCGKSRLARALADEAAGRGMRVLRGGCLEHDPLPYALWRRTFDPVLRQARRRPGDDPLPELVRRFGPLLGDLSPEFQALVGGGATPSHDQLEELLSRLLLALSREQGGLVWLIEDLDRADEGSRRVLRRLVATMGEESLLVLATGREGPWSWDGLRLGPLDDESLRALLADQLGGGAPELLDRLVAVSRGNPLSALEMLRALLDGGRLRPHWGEWRLAPDATLDLPESLLAVVMERLDELQPSTREQLERAAVAGRAFPSELLDSEALAEARWAQLVEGEGELVFGHEEVRQALLQRLSPEARRQAHRELARSADDLFRRAYHLVEGGAEGAFEAALEAGRKAREPERAEWFLNRARELGPPEHRELALALGEVAALRGRTGEALEHLHRALEPGPDPEVRAALARVHWMLYDAPGCWAHVRAALEELEVPYSRNPLAALRTGKRTRLQVALYTVAGHVGYLEQRPWDVLCLALRCHLAARRLGPSRELAAFYSALATGVASVGLPPGKLLDRAVAVAERIDDPVARATAEAYRAMAAHFRGNAHKAERLAKDCLEQRGAWLSTADSLNLSADLVCNLRIRGYAEEALAVSDQSARKDSNPHRDHVLFYNRLPLLATLGRAAEGMREAERLTALAEERGRPRYPWSCLCQFKAALYLEQEEVGRDFDQALADWEALGYRPPGMPFHKQDFYVYKAYGRYLQGDRKAFREALSQLRRVARIPTLRAHLLVLEAAEARLSGRPFEGKLARGEALAHRVDSPWALFEALRLRARALEGESALRVARQALELARHHGWVYRAAHLRREFGLGPASASSQAVRLERQLEVLLQVSLATARVLDPDRRVRTVLEEIVRVLGAERALLFLVTENDLRLTAGRDHRGAEVSAAPDFSLSLVEEVHRSGRARLVSGADPSVSMILHDLRSLAAAPVRLGHRAVGVVYADSRLARGVFTEADLELLQALANHVAVGLETVRAARLEAEVWSERRQRALTTELNELATALGSTLEVESVSATLTEEATGLIPCRWAAFVSEHGTWLAWPGQPAVAAGAWEGGLRELASSLEEPVNRQLESSPVEAGHTSLLAAPIAEGRLLLGGDTPFSGDSFDRLLLLAAHAEAALANAQLYRALRDSQAQVVQSSKLAAVGQLAAGVAHELNTPLGSIKLALESIRNRPDRPPERIASVAQLAETAAEQAREIVAKLLYYSREAPLGLRSTDLNQVVRDTVTMLGQAQVELELEELPQLHLNQSEIQQVVLNLLLNARDAVAEVDAERRVVRVTTRHEAGHVILEVADQGVGMAPEVLERIFEPFFTTKEVGRGTGLGLSVSRQIVTAHGGSLECSSEPGRGALFRMTLPT